MKPFLQFAPLALAAGLLVSCDNPADDTVDAEVGDAKEKKLEKGGEGSVKYVFTDATKIDFTASKFSGQTKSGGFKGVTGHFTIKGGEPVGNDHRVEIDMNSIWSEADNLTDHLKNEDFFDVPQFPKSVYDVTEITKISDGKYKVTGNLEMHGVTKSVAFEADVVETDGVAKITAEFDIDRSLWGITYEGKKDDIINNEVILKFDLEAKAE